METENKYRKDTTKDHPLFNGNPVGYFLGQSWRGTVPKTCGPRGYWLKVTFTNPDSVKPYTWIWVDDTNG